jgi:hypothetical protein
MAPSKIKEFRALWDTQYAHFGYTPSVKEITNYMEVCSERFIDDIQLIVNLFADHVLSQEWADSIQE